MEEITNFFHTSKVSIAVLFPRHQLILCIKVIHKGYRIVFLSPLTMSLEFRLNVERTLNICVCVWTTLPVERNAT